MAPVKRALIAFALLSLCLTALPQVIVRAEGPVKVEVDKGAGLTTMDPPGLAPAPQSGPDGPRDASDGSEVGAHESWWSRLRHNLTSPKYWWGLAKGLVTTLAIAAVFIAIAAVSAPAAIVIGVAAAGWGLYSSYRAREAEQEAVGVRKGFWPTLGVAALDTLGLSGFYEGSVNKRLLTGVPLSDEEAGRAMGTSIGAVAAIIAGPKAVKTLRATEPVQGLRARFPEITRWPWQKPVGASALAPKGQGGTLESGSTPKGTEAPADPAAPEGSGGPKSPKGSGSPEGTQGQRLEQSESLPSDSASSEKTTSTGSDAPAADPYEVAKNGGKHNGTYELYKGKPRAQIEKGIQSLEEQIAKHKAKIANPSKFIEDWDNLDPRQQQALLTKTWPRDIARQMELKAIMEGILREGDK